MEGASSCDDVDELLETPQRDEARNQRANSRGDGWREGGVVLEGAVEPRLCCALTLGGRQRE